MKVFEFGGIIFNAENVCTVQKVVLEGDLINTETDEHELIPAFQIVTVAGGVNFTFNDVKERDQKFNELLNGLQRL